MTLAFLAALPLLLAPSDELRLDDLDAWREHLRPAREELAYEEIDWISDFALGVRASEEQQKPLLFWAMNGHPLGCT